MQKNTFYFNFYSFFYQVIILIITFLNYVFVFQVIIGTCLFLPPFVLVKVLEVFMADLFLYSSVLLIFIYVYIL